MRRGPSFFFFVLPLERMIFIAAFSSSFLGREEDSRVSVTFSSTATTRAAPTEGSVSNTARLPSSAKTSYVAPKPTGRSSVFVPSGPVTRGPAPGPDISVTSKSLPPSVRYVLETHVPKSPEGAERGVCPTAPAEYPGISGRDSAANAAVPKSEASAISTIHIRCVRISFSSLFLSVRNPAPILLHPRRNGDG